MTTDAARPRQRHTGGGWSPEAHESGGLGVGTRHGEVDFAASAKPAELLPAEPGAARIVVAAPAVTRPLALPGLGDVMPAHPAHEPVEASWGAA